MTFVLECAVSEAQIEPNDVTGEPPIDPKQVAFVRIGPYHKWVQITFGMLRCMPDGDEIAFMEGDTEFWRLEPGLPVLQTTPEGLLFTDIIIAEVGE